MALLLNIDTATEHASVCLSKDGHVLAMQESNDQKNHGAFLQPAIRQLCLSANIELSAIDAVAVTEGPGSYTGLRVGMASAKGLCYALNRPLILLNTLEVMAYASIHPASSTQHPAPALYCPMIDARRMEVFAAVYDAQLQVVMPPSAVILTEQSFEKELEINTIVFSGSGHSKFKAIIQHPNAMFDGTRHNASHIAPLAENKFQQQQFANLAYSQPFYLKEFFSPMPVKNG